MTMINQRSTLQIEAICDRNQKKRIKGCLWWTTAINQSNLIRNEKLKKLLIKVIIIIICRSSRYRNLLNTYFMQLVFGRSSLSSLIRGRRIFRSTHYTGFINWCRTNVGHAQSCNIWRYCRIGSHKLRTHDLTLHCWK